MLESLRSTAVIFIYLSFTDNLDTYPYEEPLFYTLDTGKTCLENTKILATVICL
jgi:hypothetical protein